MASVPLPKSYEQILSDMLASYMASRGISDLNTGSAVTSFFEAMAQAVYRASADNFSILRDFNVDRASGEKLKRIAREEFVKVDGDRVAIGTVTIRDTSFDKISTKIYAGGNPPNIGSNVIKVSEASLFSATGSIYIGRGTPNVEGPLAYSSITTVGGYYEINLTSITSKFHNISESVILAQGGVRTVAAGQVVVSPTSGVSGDVNFTLTQQAVILDGENSITSVPVAAQDPGSDGNVPRNGIKKFSSNPFSGASVTNDSPFTTGKNADTDPEIRTRIKLARISRGLGTAIAVKSAVLGAKAPDENAVIKSNEIFSDGVTTTMFIDDGEGYEEKTDGVGLEFIIDSALGGEKYFQLATGGRQTSVAKAFLVSNATAPFQITGGDRLAILVGGEISQHTFENEDFRSPGNATADEVISSINANPTSSYSASTIENRTRVVIFSREEESEFLEKTVPTFGNDAGELLGLPVGEIQTLRLYKNKKALNRNGRPAKITTENQSNWSNAITTGDTILLSVDGTQEITYTFTNSDFLEEGSYTSVSKNNSLESWVNVFNTKITGVTASINGNQIFISSNLGSSSRASLSINPTSTLVVKGLFTALIGLEASGLEADFILSRNTAQFKLIEPLEAGDSLTAGTEFTKGSIVSSPFVSNTVTLINDAYLWFLIDNKDASYINTGVISDTTISVTKPAVNVIRYTSNDATAFDNVEVGDWVILWSTDLSTANRLEAKVYANAANYIELKVTPSEYGSAVIEGPIVWGEGIAVVRTKKAIQKVKIASGSYNINSIAASLSENIIGATSVAENDEFISVTTQTEGLDGEVFVITFDESGKLINFEENTRQSSQVSLFAFQVSEASDNEFPLFIHEKITDDSFSDPPNSTVSDFDSAADISSLGINPNAQVTMEEPFGLIPDNISSGESVQIDAITANNIEIDSSQLIRRLRVADRFHVADTYQFGANDGLTVILDSNSSDKTFSIPLYRRAITNNTTGINSNNFRAYDTASGATTQFEEFFGAEFAFKNYRALMQARNVLHPTNPMANQDAVIFRSVDWGYDGERYNVGYIYPTSDNQPMTHVVSVGTSVNIRIALKSGNAVLNAIDGTTEWDVTVTNMGAYDAVTYTWNATGTNPSIDSALSSGGYATVIPEGEFALENTGTFRVSSSTSSSFTTIREVGAATAESNKATLTNNTIRLYLADNTTAAEVVAYCSSNLADYLTSVLVDDSGTTGAGVISKSTEEDSDFAYVGINLLDGINWIEISDLDAAAPTYQFRFKKALSIPSFNTSTANAYAFNTGEEVRLIPTTAKQLSEFLNVLAVTGFTTLGDINTSSRDRKIQLRTNILGSNGAVQIAGGRGNSSQAPLLQSASKVEDSDMMKAIILRSASEGLYSNQWVKLEALRAQKKDTGMGFATVVDITANAPTAGQSTIELSSRTSADLYFGEPRNFFRDRNRTFQVEKHGKLVCISWTEVGSSPVFSKTVEINDASSTVAVNYNEATGYTEYTVSSGVVNFLESQRSDVAVITNFTNAENNGTFPVVGVSDDGSVLVVDNPDGIDAVGQVVAAGSFVISAKIREGDSVVIDDSFATLNRGTFRVIRPYSNSFYIENINAVEEVVTVASNLRSLGFSGTTEFDVVVSSGVMRVEWNSVGTQPTLSLAKFGDVATFGTDFDADNQGNFMVLKSGVNYIEVANSKAVVETNLTITDVFEAHNPSVVFSDYDATVVGDRFINSGDVFDGDNVGDYSVVAVLDRNTIVVGSILASKTAVQLADKFIQVYIEEFLKYVGYKQIYSKAVDPGNSSRTDLIFTTNDQYLKSNRDAGEVSVYAIGKLNFSTSVKLGLDSYKFNTGLIAEANRITYGDPRDNASYPGTSAAGAEIFIKSSLKRRIRVGVGVRVNTGIPFSKIAEQVRNNVSSLINSSGVGVSIAISDIVSVVNSIPGVKAVSITSPSYNITNDVIAVNPSEKAFIIDPINDIQISKVG